MIVFLRLGDVCKAKACGKSSLYEEIQEGLFTPPVKTGKRASAWPSYEVQTLNKARVAGKTEAEIKQIVSGLLAARRAVDDPAIMAVLTERRPYAPIEGNAVADSARLVAETSSSRSRKERGPKANSLEPDGGQIL